MVLDPNKMSIKERYEHLLKLIKSDRFLKMEGLGNEIPFFICPYPPKDTVDMVKMQGQLLNRLQQQGVSVLNINLYDLSIEILQKRNIWERILETEQALPREQLMELLQGVLDSKTHLVPAMAEKMANTPFDVMFLSGIGEVFPYIRSHNILNNLQSTAKNRPTVIFFPGAYTYSSEDGASLDLFGRLHDDKYYRAFNIFHCEV